MTITECHYAFKLGMDRVDSLSTPDFYPEEIDWFLNEAQHAFIKNRMSALSNPKNRGFEASKKRIDDLSTIVIKYPLQPYIVPTLDSGVYEVDLYDLAYSYMYFVSAYCELLVAPSCTKEVPLKFIQHDDYRIALRDPFNSPSLEFVPYNFGKSSSTDHDSSSIYMYPADYTVTKVYVEYIKEPRRAYLGTYTYIDGSIIDPQDLELPASTHEEIVNMAVMLASLAVQNPEYITTRMQKLAMHE